MKNYSENEKEKKSNVYYISDTHQLILKLKFGTDSTEEITQIISIYKILYIFLEKHRITIHFGGECYTTIEKKAKNNICFVLKNKDFKELKRIINEELEF